MNKFPIGLKFEVEKLGSVRDGRFTQKPLTVFCGPNNTGKTWVMYSLYHLHQWLRSTRQEFREEKENGDQSKPAALTLENFNKKVSGTLADLFNAAPGSMQEAKFSLHPDTDWQALLASNQLSDIFLMPAERNGLHLFFRELSTRRTALLHHASREKIDIGELLRDVIRSRYAIPIAHYIDWLNDLAERQKSKSAEFHPFAGQVKRQLAGGAYSVDARTGSIEFKPYQHRRDGKKTTAMGLHMTSSTVKSLFGLWFYLEHQAEPGDLLMIDEPELNVHPENQRKIARLLARLVNAGLNITLSTHSDYIVRELNTLIMLGQEGAEGLREKHGYEEDETLSTDQVAAYLFDEQTITPFEITPDDGIYATTFDDVIDELNSVNNDVYYSLQEQKNV